jgi:NitT/TauT family transport system substrate-binding protein
VSIKIMVGGLSKQIYLPNMLTQQLGYFDTEHLHVTLIDEASGQASEDEVVAGNVEAGSGAYNHTIQLQVKGKLIETVCQFGLSPGEAELVRTGEAASISSMADLKGKNLGVTEVGSGTYVLTQALLAKAGVPPAQATYVAVGAGQTFIAAMQNNRIDAGMTTEPTISTVVNSGLGKVLVDLRTPTSTEAALGGDYPFIGIFMLNDYVNSHPDVVQRVVNAYTKTLQWIHSHSAAEIAAKMPADYYAGNLNAYVQALQNQLAMFGTGCSMPASGPATVVRILQQYTGLTGTVDVSKTYTNEFAAKAS